MIRLVVLLLSVFISVSAVKSQEVTVDAGADIVSSYVWRGLYVGPASVQPSISLSSGGFTLGVWGSSSFNATWREFDLFAGYSIGNFNFLITDYFLPHDLPDGEKISYFDFSEHVVEATLGFSLGESVPLSFVWNTNFIGDDDYSSYFEASYSIPTSFVDIDLIVGATPSAGFYSDGFALVVTAIKASKEISINDTFSIPVYTQAILNPDSKDVFLVFGMKF
jgi:hypothetical protein